MYAATFSMRARKCLLHVVDGRRKSDERNKWRKKILLFAYLIRMYINFEITSFLCQICFWFRFVLLRLFLFPWFTSSFALRTPFFCSCWFAYTDLIVRVTSKYTIREWKCVFGCLFDAFAVEIFRSGIYLSLKFIQKALRATNNFNCFEIE